MNGPTEEARVRALADIEALRGRRPDLVAPFDEYISRFPVSVAATVLFLENLALRGRALGVISDRLSRFRVFLRIMVYHGLPDCRDSLYRVTLATSHYPAMIPDHFLAPIAPVPGRKTSARRFPGR